MREYRVVVPPEIAEVVRKLPPQIKRAIRAALRQLASNPAAGEPLQSELAGRLKYRVRRYRIVYRLENRSRVLRIVGIGHRRNIYEELTELARTEE
jgi:mRNA interferase RelE/StbE